MLIYLELRTKVTRILTAAFICAAVSAPAMAELPTEILSLRAGMPFAPTKEQCIEAIADGTRLPNVENGQLQFMLGDTLFTVAVTAIYLDCQAVTFGEAPK